MTDTNDNVDTVTYFFTFTEQTYVEAMWFLSWTDADGTDTDVMAAVYRDTPESPWRATYRFRYYASGDAWDGQDKKSGYHMRANEATDAGGTTDAARDRMVQAMDLLAKMTAERFTLRQNWRGVVRGPAEAAMKLVGEQPFMHCKVVASEPGRPQ